jgi:uncharacterized protein
MRVTADTNVIISAFLWRGNPRRVLDSARDGIIELFTSMALLGELEEVLKRIKFAKRLTTANVTVQELVEGFAALANVVRGSPGIIPEILRFLNWEW